MSTYPDPPGAWVSTKAFTSSGEYERSFVSVPAVISADETCFGFFAGGPAIAKDEHRKMAPIVKKISRRIEVPFVFARKSLNGPHYFGVF
jgi:hypothetical protein